MSIHEIEIEGLGPEWEPVKLVVRLPATAVDGSYECVSSQELVIRRKVRKYDWSKTLDDVLVLRPNTTGMTLYCGHGRPTAIPDGIWQPNLHGKCPVDGEACIVRVRLADGQEYQIKASNATWDTNCINQIVAWQFIRLVDGYKW